MVRGAVITAGVVATSRDFAQYKGEGPLVILRTTLVATVTKVECQPFVAPSDSQDRVIRTTTMVTAITGRTVNGYTGAPNAMDNTQGSRAQISSDKSVSLPFVSLPPGPTTPINIARLAQVLENYPYKHLTRFILDGLRGGFDIGYTGPVLETRPNNARSTIGCESGVTEAIKKELVRGHTSGPFIDPPFPVTHVSPLGAREKPDGSVRLILDLSSPRGMSINENIDQSDFSCQYMRFDEAIQAVQAQGRGCFMSKLDIRHAFRLCPVRPSQWCLLSYRWQGMFFVDTVLPFGGRSSPYIFNTFADALCWIFITFGSIVHLLHYLDDFFTCHHGESRCGRDRDSIIRICEELGVPLAPDKIEGPAQRITFLGIEIDTVSMRVQLPPEKIKKLKEKLEGVGKKKRITKKDLLSLIGSLSFASKVVKPGRMFLRRLITLSTKVSSLHHYITINEDARADIEWWRTFLVSWNGVEMMPGRVRSSPDMDLYTDASDLGFGCVFGGRWTYGSWNREWKSKSINAREAFAIWVAVYLWGREWRDGQVVIHTDSEVNTRVWKTGSCRDPDVMAVIRRMFMFSARINLSVTLLHIPGVKNIDADHLSRLKVDEFRTSNPRANRLPTRVEQECWRI